MSKVLFLSGFLALPLAFQMPVATVDLVTAARADEAALLLVPLSEGVDRLPPKPVIDHEKPPLPSGFVVDSFSFDRSTYAIGDSFEYELSIRHTGSDTATFPTSLETHRFRRSMPTLQRAELALSFTAPEVGRQLQVAETLFGSEEIGGSLVSLGPNQKLAIRGAGIWTIRSAGSAPVWPMTVTPSIELIFRGSPRTLPASLASATVTLQRQ